MRAGALDATERRCRRPWRAGAPAATRRRGWRRAQPALGPAPPLRRAPRPAAGAGDAAAGFGASGALAARCRLRRPPHAARLGVLAFRRQHRDELVDRHVLGAFRHDDLGQHAVVDGLVFHRRLVGLDLGDDVAGLDRVAFFLEPTREVALLHRGRQRRHEDVHGHGGSSWPLAQLIALVVPGSVGGPSRLRRCVRTRSIT